MTNNKVNRNYWFVLAVATAGAFIVSAVDMISDGGEWRSLIPSAMISAMCLSFFLRYRRAVKKGNIYGDVRLFDFRRKPNEERDV